MRRGTGGDNRQGQREPGASGDDDFGGVGFRGGARRADAAASMSRASPR